MWESTPKERMLKKIRKALIEKCDNPYPKSEADSIVFSPVDDLSELVFAERFTLNGGQFVYCEDEIAFMENILGLAEEHKWQKIYCWEQALQHLLDKYAYPFGHTDTDFLKADASITLCEALIASTGSILISNGKGAGRRLSIYPPVHLVLGYTSQVTDTLKDAFLLVQKNYENNPPSLISVISGPSCTADIANIVVKGAHGPAQLYLFLLEDRKEI